MNALPIVFNAEFVRRITSRAFLAGTIIGAVSIVLLAVLPSLLGTMMASSSRKIVLVGSPALTTAATHALAHDFDVTATLPRLTGTPTAAFLDAHGKASAVALLEAGPRGLHVTAYARDPSLFQGAFARDLASLQIALALGVPTARVEASSTVHVDVHDVSGRFASADAADAAKGIAYLFVFLLYLSILMNAQAIMTSVAEEKTSRIAELLVAMIPPAQLLSAKVLAAAATSFIQLGIWIVAGMLSGRAVTTMFAHGAAASAPSSIVGSLAVSPFEILAFLAFFTVGFAQYGVLYAAAASLINRTEDIGSVSAPLIVPVVIGFLLATIGLQVPNSPVVVVCSLIPLLSPFVMFTRIATTTVPVWQIVLSLVLNVAAAVVLAWLSGKIYRVGLLLYGRAPSLKQVVATLRA